MEQLTLKLFDEIVMRTEHQLTEDADSKRDNCGKMWHEYKTEPVIGSPCCCLEMQHCHSGKVASSSGKRGLDNDWLFLASQQLRCIVAAQLFVSRRYFHIHSFCSLDNHTVHVCFPRKRGCYYATHV